MQRPVDPLWVDERVGVRRADHAVGVAGADETVHCGVHHYSTSGADAGYGGGQGALNYIDSWATSFGVGAPNVSLVQSRLGSKVSDNIGRVVGTIIGENNNLVGGWVDGYTHRSGLVSERGEGVLDEVSFVLGGDGYY